MVIQRKFFGLVITAIGLALPALADESQQNLLVGSQWAAGQVSAPDAETLARLTDGDPATVVSLPVIDDQPVELVFRLPGDIAAPDRLTLALSSNIGDMPPTELDVLVSSISENVGFKSIRTKKIDGLTTQVDFRFTPASAQWAMIRLTPQPGSSSVTIGDLALLGQIGPPESVYAFDQSPAEAIALIQGLLTLDPQRLSLTDTETALFAQASAGPLSAEQFEQIALLASGVRSQEDRARFQDRIAALEARLRADIDLGGQPSDMGGALLDWLHRELLTGGYVEGQTNLSDLLDGGVYNCVSSAVIYAALGQRLGLDVRAIEVPDHAFAILYDGADHSDVETTTAQGFDPSRDRQAAFEQLTGYTYIPQANKAKRREINLAGLAALIYYNHGVFALQDGRYADALLANFRALSLDPEFDSAVKNALAALGRWSVDLAEQGNWEDAVQTAGVGVSLAPDDRGLVARQSDIWRRWANDRSAAGDLAGGLDVLQRASLAVEGEDFADAQAYLFIRSGEDFIKSGDWTSALTATDSSGHNLSDAATDALAAWRRDVYLRWSGTALDTGDFAAARDILGAGLAIWPEDSRILGNLRYVAYEGAAAAGSYANGLAFLSDTITAFPHHKKLVDTAESFVARAVNDPALAPDIASGLALVTQAAALFDDPGVPQDLGARVFERHGHVLIDAADWPAAAEIYAAGRSAYPTARILTTNARFVAQNWQRVALDQGGPEALADVNARLRVLFPDFAGSSDFGETEIKRQVTALANAGQIAEAQTALDAGQLVLSSETYQDLSVYIIDRNARRDMDAGNWSAAAHIYAAGLGQFPGDGHLQRNAVYVAQEWTRSVAASDGADALSQTMRTLESLFPGNTKIAEMGLTTLRHAVLDAISDGRTDEARQLVAMAKPTLSPPNAEELTVTLFDALAQTHMQTRDWAAAMDTYAQGRALYPQARPLSRNLGYIAQEWIADAFASDGADGVIAAFIVLKRQYDDAKALDRTIESLFGRQASTLLGNGDPDGALDLIDAASAAMATDTAVDLKVYIYDQWARQTGESEGWPAAVLIYDLAIAEIGDNRTLTNNRKWAASQ